LTFLVTTIMKWCLRVKLAANWMAFSQLLNETGERPIVEDSRKDDFWGAKPKADDYLEGRNVLGRLLMELRQKLRDDPGGLQIVRPVPIPDFTLLTRPIGTIVARAALPAEVDRPYACRGERQTAFL
jgi:NADAR domain